MNFENFMFDIWGMDNQAYYVADSGSAHSDWEQCIANKLTFFKDNFLSTNTPCTNVNMLRVYITTGDIHSLKDSHTCI